VPDQHRRQSVATQEADARSALHALRQLLRWRKRHAALVRGDIEFIDAPPDVLAFWRTRGAERLVAVFNFSNRALAVSLAELQGVTALEGHGLPTGRPDGVRLSLPVHGAFFGTITATT